ncbi:hypothetical protein [Mesorhizobium silamurunense]|uniref:hypothetical protein n=1 Tax=Mesorhizobium silamurunense TaxID=499528 RepID=UPI00177DA7E9|nr:hypothetical protein [Mesorhizobium silamurunense]
MILGIPVDQLTSVANFLGLAFLGLLAIIGFRRGRSSLIPTGEVELAGALVDSAAVKMLAAAIEANTAESIAARKDREKDRQALYRLIEMGNRFVDEVSEMRHEIGDLSKEIARRR